MLRLDDLQLLNLLCAADEAGRDVFLLDGVEYDLPAFSAAAARLPGRALLLTPGAFYPDGDLGEVTMLSEPWRLPALPEETGRLFLSPVDFARDAAFLPLLEKTGIRTLFLPFAELADPYSYGYRRAYREIGERRGECPFSLRIFAQLSLTPEKEEQLTGFYNSGKYILLGDRSPAAYPALRLGSQRSVEQFVLNEAAKHVFGGDLVLCPTRGQAGRLQQDAAMRGVPAALVHGGRTAQENLAAVQAFRRGECKALFATKHILSSFLFMKARRVYFCGLPYDEGHYLRMRRLLSDPSELPVVVYAPQSFDEILDLSASLAKKAGINVAAFTAERARRLRAFTEKLED